jgi:hypothetical protein
MVSPVVQIARGNIYIDAEVYKLYFGGTETVALLQRTPGFLIMPIFSFASGGRIVKVRNSRGDRVVTAPDFLREHGFEDENERTCKVHWDSGTAALVVEAEGD